MHGLIFETSICYWQDQPGCYSFSVRAAPAAAAEAAAATTSGRGFVGGKKHKVSFSHKGF
jgi:hypothetical protein